MNPSRREVLAWAAASAALASCTRPVHGQAWPAAERPPGVTPGEPKRYATAAVEEGYATGLLVRVDDGRPTKIEGNPKHPASLGATSARHQALVLDLYDPDRQVSLREGTTPRSRSAFLEAIDPRRGGVPADGAAVHLMMEPTSSPLVERLLERLGERMPKLSVHFASPVDDGSSADGAKLAFGAPIDRLPDLRGASVVVAVDGDALGAGPTHLADARAFADRRRSAEARLIALESTPSGTGVAADDRIALKPSEIGPFFARVAVDVLSAGGEAGALGAALSRIAVQGALGDVAGALARDLLWNRGSVSLLVGPTQPAWVHAVAHVLDDVLGAPGATVSRLAPVRLGAGTAEWGLQPLLDALDAGAVDTLFVLGGNPAYAWPADLELGRRLRLARRLVRLGAHEDETSELADWFVPERHALESWGDARSADGTVTLQQPVLEPLAGGLAVAEVLSGLLGQGDVELRELLEASWRERTPVLFDQWWRKAVRQGFVDQTASPPVDVRARPDDVAGAVAASPQATGLEIVFRPCPRIGDGRWANVGWLQEWPDPVTQVAWGNVARIAPATAERLGVADGEIVWVGLGGRSIRLPARRVPGQAEDTVAVDLGYGRTDRLLIAKGVGANANLLRTAARPWADAGATLSPTGDVAELPLAQTTDGRDDRRIARHVTLAEWVRLAEAPEPEPPRLYGEFPEHLSGEHQWAMSIDLGACVGCGACGVACQAENNVPIVGPVDVAKGRRMHWLRIDRYVAEDGRRTTFEPMLCQHCEDAPCEVVCPVNATVHSPDGLNEQVYNRCVGTRFCSNNCPYKVRRFNWFDYANYRPASEQAQLNPEVTVRDRGVMEKCTFCVQRIRKGVRDAKLGDGRVADGEIVTACAQACPTGAIVFGDLKDPESQVARLRGDPRAYAELGELGTRPRVRYLTRVDRPNPDLAPPRKEG